MVQPESSEDRVTTADRPSRKKSPLNAAIDVQALQTEKWTSFGGLACSVFGLLLISLLSRSMPEGAPFRELTAPRLFGFTLFLLLWYAAALLLLSRGLGRRVVPWISTVIEASIPLGIMLAEARSEQPSYLAFVSFGPAFYSAGLVLGTARMRWYFPLVAGVFGAAQYFALLWLYVVPALGALPTQPPLKTWAFLLARPLWVAVLGVVTALVVKRMRTSMGQAHREVRKQELFGKYRLGEPIAGGGMGEVVKALYCPEGGFERPVAIKRIHRWLATDQRFVDAFRREASLCARLTHANIVQVFDFGQESGSYFLAMEYVDGVTLHQILRVSISTGQAITPGTTVAVGSAIAAALGFAHTEATDGEGKRLHVIHRDLSPGNVLISRAGDVKVTDFGIAKALGNEVSTQTNTVAGKIAYMAPEQALAEPLDERCDLFALGVVLWEMLCGRFLFADANDAVSLRNLLEARIPAPSEVRPALRNSGWDEFFARALSRDQGSRFQTALELRNALGLLGASPDSRAELVLWVGRARDLISASRPPPVAGPDDRTQPARERL